MSRNYQFRRKGLGIRKPDISTILSDLNGMSETRQRERDIRGLAMTLECLLGAVGGFGYATLLGFDSKLTNTAALRLFVERELPVLFPDDQPVDALVLLAKCRRALDRGHQDVFDLFGF